MKSVNVSMALSLLFQSDSLISATIFLNSSIIMGSMGFDTRLFCFLNVLVVVLKPLGPVIEALLLLKSEADENLPKPSLPAACYEPLY
jgi:hypothetical protein